MKVLWLCNIIPGKVQQALGSASGDGLWVDHALTDLLNTRDLVVRALSRGGEDRSGIVDAKFSYGVFTEPKPFACDPALEARFSQELLDFQPDVIHIWGTEYGHTLAMVNAAHKLGMHQKVVISIQGLCSVYAKHYCEGLPHRIQSRYTLRDFLRQDNILQQQEVFRRRGELEVEAMRKVNHVIGRTGWDRICAQQIHPGVTYHHCNETLRHTFYEGQWQYDLCRKHAILAPNCYYPIKGFHYLLEAFAEVLKTYPDATLAVPGEGYLPKSRKKKLLQDGYRKYMAELTHRYGLQDKIIFLGALDAEGMKRAFLNCNVFALPSTIENSPNTLGEAMLLGVPCVAADVGGVSDMLLRGQEGFVYPSTAAYMLAGFICDAFALKDRAAEMGSRAAAHARVTHDPEKNREALLSIYQEIAKG